MSLRIGVLDAIKAQGDGSADTFEKSLLLLLLQHTARIQHHVPGSLIQSYKKINK